MNSGKINLSSNFRKFRIYLVSRELLWKSLLFFLLSYFFFPTSKSHNTLFYATVLPLFILTVRCCNIKYLACSRIYLSAIGYLVYLYLTIAWGEATAVSDYWKYGFRLLYLICYISVVATAFSNSEYESQFYRWLCWVAAVAAVFSIIRFYQDHPFPGGRLSNWGGLEVVITGASCYGFAAIICCYKFLVAKKFNPLYILIFLILVTDLLFAQSRGPVLAFLVAVLVGESIRKNFKWVFLVIASVIVYGCLIVFDILEPNTIFTRFAGRSSYRVEIWQAIIAMVSEAPWFGYGLTMDETIVGSSGRSFDHPHSVYFSSLLYGGITGLAMLMVLVGLSLYHGYKQEVVLSNPLPLVLLLYGLICIMTDNDKVLTHPDPIWLYFWFPIALLVAKELKQNQGAIRT